MKTITPQLKAGLASGKRCYLVKVTTITGVVYGFTNHDSQIDYLGVIYTPTGGLEQLDSYYTDNAEVSGTKLKMAYVDVDETLVRAGVFDNADYVVLRVVWDDLSLGAYEHDVGKLGIGTWNEVQMNHESFGFERELVKPLGIQHTAKCPHKLGDALSAEKPGACTVNLTAFTETGMSVTGINVQRMKVVVSNSGRSNKFFEHGRVTWLTGNNAGTISPVKNHSTGGSETINFSIPTKLPIQVGDTFDAVAGCDQTFPQCNVKFNNGINYGGDPFMNVGATRR
jgi:uncharacterized phage protein (TIGR02218 family)